MDTINHTSVPNHSNVKSVIKVGLIQLFNIVLSIFYLLKETTSECYIEVVNIVYK